MIKDFHELPRLKDSISYLYFDKANIEQENTSIVSVTSNGRIPIPVSSVTCLLLGPGTRITHSAVKVCAENGCMIIWCGDKAGRFYASGTGETRSSEKLLQQAKMCMDEELHLQVVRRMYEIRFPKLPDKSLTLQQIRGMEGIRVREAYRQASKNTGVKWKGRNYKTDDWNDTDPLNRAISSANALLHSLCHAGIVSLGYSPALGFIHTGKMLSFVYDVADFYKATTTVPAAFEAVALGEFDVEKNARIISRRYFARERVLKKLAKDIAWVLSGEEDSYSNEKVGDLWDDVLGTVGGGVNYAEEYLDDGDNN